MGAWKRLPLSAVSIGLVAVLLSVASCGGDEETPAGQTATQGATTTSPAATIPPELNTAVDAFAAALRDRDRDRLRDGTGDALRQRLRDQDLDRLRTCVPQGGTVEVISRDATVERDEATVRVRLRLTDAAGQTQEVEREWTFERRADGTWALKEFPDCPFASGSSTTTTDGSTTDGQETTETETETAP